jgi:hypothetical protein
MKYVPTTYWQQQACRFFCCLITFILLYGCDLAAPESRPGQSREITRVIISMTELNATGEATGPTFTGWFSDPDGLGGDPPATSTLVLRPFTNLVGSVRFIDERMAQPVDLTPWLETRSDQIRIFYEVRFDETPEATLEIEVTDRDRYDLPVGIHLRAQTSTPRLATGRLRILLSRFEPSQKASGDRPPYSIVDAEIPFLILAPP